MGKKVVAVVALLLLLLVLFSLSASSKPSASKAEARGKIHPELLEKIDALKAKPLKGAHATIGASPEAVANADIIFTLSSNNDFNKMGKIRPLLKKLKSQSKLGKAVSAEISLENIEALAEVREVVGIWPDFEVFALLESGLQQVHAPIAWGNGFTGNGVRVAVVDTGID